MSIIHLFLQRACAAKAAETLFFQLAHKFSHMFLKAACAQKMRSDPKSLLQAFNAAGEPSTAMEEPSEYAKVAKMWAARASPPASARGGSSGRDTPAVASAAKAEPPERGYKPASLLKRLSTIGKQARLSLWGLLLNPELMNRVCLYRRLLFKGHL